MQTYGPVPLPADAARTRDALLELAGHATRKSRVVRVALAEATNSAGGARHALLEGARDAALQGRVVGVALPGTSRDGVKAGTDLVAVEVLPEVADLVAIAYAVSAFVSVAAGETGNGEQGHERTKDRRLSHFRVPVGTPAAGHGR